MEKPITLRRRDMIEKVCDAINESALPAFVIRDALKAIDDDLARAQEDQYNRDLQAWTVYQVKQGQKDTKETEVDNGLE